MFQVKNSFSLSVPSSSVASSNFLLSSSIFPFSSSILTSASTYEHYRFGGISELIAIKYHWKLNEKSQSCNWFQWCIKLPKKLFYKQFVAFSVSMNDKFETLSLMTNTVKIRLKDRFMQLQTLCSFSEKLERIFRRRMSFTAFAS